MGGLITLATIEGRPDEYDGALPLCGILSPTLEWMRGVFDLLVSFDYLYPGVLSASPRGLADLPAAPLHRSARRSTPPCAPIRSARRRWPGGSRCSRAASRAWCGSTRSSSGSAGARRRQPVRQPRQRVSRPGQRQCQRRRGAALRPGSGGRGVPADALYAHRPHRRSRLRRPHHLRRHRRARADGPLPRHHAGRRHDARFAAAYVVADGHCTFTPAQVGAAFDALRTWAATGRRPAEGEVR